MEIEKNLCNDAHYGQFYNNHVKHAYNFAFYRCGDSKQSEDLLQEAFIKIWERCSDIAFAKAKSYLFTTINNLFLNQVAHKKVVLKHAEAQPYDDTSNVSPEHVLREKEFQTELDDAIAGLSEKDRQVFLLNRIDGLKYREIAEMLDISQKTVEKRMSAALKTLRGKIKEFS